MPEPDAESESVIHRDGIDELSVRLMAAEGPYAPTVHFDHEGNSTILIDKDSDGVYELGITAAGEYPEPLWHDLEEGDITEDALEYLESRMVDEHSIDLSQDFDADWKDDETDDAELATDGGVDQSEAGTHHLQGANTHPDGDRCDLEFCQRCGHAFTTALEGYFVDKEDVGPDAKGGTAEIFRLDVEDRSGDEWMGFEEQDIGPWCDQCSWHLQRKRIKEAVTDGGVDQDDGAVGEIVYVLAGSDVNGGGPKVLDTFADEDRAEQAREAIWSALGRVPTVSNVWVYEQVVR